MTNYGTLDVVKHILNLDDDFVEWNNRIDYALNRADNAINNSLQAAGEEHLPLNPVPPIIVDIANDWAAGIMRDETSNPTASDPGVTVVPGFGNEAVQPSYRQNAFMARAKAALKDYIRANYRGQIYVAKSGAAI